MDPNKVIPAPSCATCGTKHNLLCCSKCKSAHYCCVDHQHIDWPNHKRSCKTIAKKRDSNASMSQLQQAVAATSLSSISLENLNLSQNIEQQNFNSSEIMDQMASSFQRNLSYLSEEPVFKQPCKTPITTSNNCNNGLLVTTEPWPLADLRLQNDNFDNFLNNFPLENSNLTLQYPNTHQFVKADYNLLAHNVDSPISPQQSALPKPSQPEFLQETQLFLPEGQSLQHQLPQQTMQQPFQQQLPQQQQFVFYNQQNGQNDRNLSYQIGQDNQNTIGYTNERRYDELCRNIINDMNQYGLSVVDDFLGNDKGLSVLNEVHRMYSAGVFKDGQLQSNSSKTEKDLRTIRGDKITWVKGVEPGCASVGYLINKIDAVICRANSMENNGKLGQYNIKERTKAMVACYPGSGSHYVMHVDNPNKDGRVITAIYYLNLNWDTKRSGGVLRIFPEQGGNTFADIEPKFDRLIFFWSDKRNPHEVQPAHRTRYAITVWYFDANEREAALNRIKYENNKNAQQKQQHPPHNPPQSPLPYSTSEVTTTTTTTSFSSPTIANSKLTDTLKSDDSNRTSPKTFVEDHLLKHNLSTNSSINQFSLNSSSSLTDSSSSSSSSSSSPSSSSSSSSSTTLVPSSSAPTSKTLNANKHEEICT